MMTQRQFTLDYLKAIERKHQGYFDNANKGIMDFISIKGKNPVSVRVTDHDMPIEIRHDLDLMFWIS